jgi:hypothetical protein
MTKLAIVSTTNEARLLYSRLVLTFMHTLATRLRSDLFARQPAHVDLFVLCDSTCTSHLERCLASFDVTLVRSEWAANTTQEYLSGCKCAPSHTYAGLGAFAANCTYAERSLAALACTRSSACMKATVGWSRSRASRFTPAELYRTSVAYLKLDALTSARFAHYDWLLHLDTDHLISPSVLANPIETCTRGLDDEPPAVHMPAVTLPSEGDWAHNLKDFPNGSRLTRGDVTTKMLLFSPRRMRRATDDWACKVRCRAVALLDCHGEGWSRYLEQGVLLAAVHPWLRLQPNYDPPCPRLRRSGGKQSCAWNVSELLARRGPATTMLCGGLFHHVSFVSQSLIRLKNSTALGCPSLPHPYDASNRPNLWAAHASEQWDPRTSQRRTYI